MREKINKWREKNSISDLFVSKSWVDKEWKGVRFDTGGLFGLCGSKVHSWC